MVVAFYITFFTACLVIIPLYLHKTKPKKSKIRTVKLIYRSRLAPKHPWIIYMLNKR